MVRKGIELIFERQELEKKGPSYSTVYGAIVYRKSGSFGNSLVMYAARFSRLMFTASRDSAVFS